jgi:hypothetical protein
MQDQSVTATLTRCFGTDLLKDDASYDNGAMTGHSLTQHKQTNKAMMRPIVSASRCMDGYKTLRAGCIHDPGSVTHSYIGHELRFPSR